MTPLIQEPQKDRICSLLKIGATREMAAQAIGCHPRTIRRAAEKDPEFAKRMVESETKLEDKCLKAISDAVDDPKNWRAAFKLLERIYPQRYAPGKRAALSSKNVRDIAEGVVSAILSSLPDSAITPELRERLEEIAEGHIYSQQPN